MDIKKLLNDGYVLSPYYSKNDINEFTKVKKVVLNRDDLKELFECAYDDDFFDMFFSKDKLVLVKYLDTYHITPSDLINKIFTPEFYDYGFFLDEEFSWFFRLFDLKNNNGYIFLPHISNKTNNVKNDIKDFLFENDDHLVTFIIKKILDSIDRDKINEDIDNYINFIEEILEQRKYPKENRVYSKSTLSLLLSSISYGLYNGIMLSEDARKFYAENLLKNAEQEDIQSMRSLGYEYYKGTNGFPYDPIKSCYWLDKYYEATKDPDVARTLGYIYYYGRTTNGIPQGDKAFQYFSIGHTAGGYFEATYKLADCYMKGYGTPINYQCAFNLVNDIYNPTLVYFLNGNDSKFADVALRMGSFYKEGIFVQKDIFRAYKYFLKARLAIRKRLENMEYIGDRGIAMGIARSITEIEQEIGKEKRIVNKNGYLLKNSFKKVDKGKYEVELIDGYIHVVIYPSKKSSRKYFLYNIPYIGLIERTPKIEYYIKPKNKKDAEKFVELANMHKIKESIFVNNAFYATPTKSTDNDFNISFSEIVYVPQTIKDITKRYQIVSVEFYPNTKLYDYLCLKDSVMIGDQLEIEYNGRTILTTVKKVKMLYEDELPLPFEKMDKVI